MSIRLHVQAPFTKPYTSNPARVRKTLYGGRLKVIASEMRAVSLVLGGLSLLADRVGAHLCCL
ncbi:hypothetical protein BDQ12DRAFT_682221 [Crucibulum laeve]|nr:hypothetical protein BDQ12DRAFT_682221 [Crucibulum laeve]